MLCIESYVGNLFNSFMYCFYGYLFQSLRINRKNVYLTKVFPYISSTTIKYSYELKVTRYQKLLITSPVFQRGFLYD